MRAGASTSKRTAPQWQPPVWVTKASFLLGMGVRSIVPLCLAAIFSGNAAAQDADALRARHAALRAELASNAFGRPLHVRSSTSGSRHVGEVHAVLAQPFDTIAALLERPAHWCDVLALQVNVKGCVADGGRVAAGITRKPRQSLEDAHRVEFRFERRAASQDYLHASLSAPEGPVGTSDYRIHLEAVPLGEARTFLRLSYAYTLGLMARIALDAYLAGSGRDKAGFSADGARGVVERGAMRHYLAVEAFLEAPHDLEARLRGWYAAIARYPQLREEVGRDEYVAMKLAQ